MNENNAYELIHRNAENSSLRKKKADKVVEKIFLLIAMICASVVVVVLVFILIKGLMPFFKKYTENGNPESTISGGYFFGGQMFEHGYNEATGHYEYGVLHLVLNTLLLNLLTALLAIPLSVLTALFIARIAPKGLARVIETGVELLAAIPSVIFGLFGMGVVVPIIGRWAKAWGMITANGVSMLTGALILTLMIAPTIISVSVTALKAVDNAQIQGSLALGASKTQTDFKIALRAAKSGIFAGIILGIGRSLGEATAVAMVCGSPISGITLNPFMPIVTLSSQILLALGEAVPGSLNYDVRFSAGMMLMVLILVFNFILNDVKNHITDPDNVPLALTKVYRFFKRLFTKRKEKKAK